MGNEKRETGNGKQEARNRNWRLKNGGTGTGTRNVGSWLDCQR